VTTTAIILFAIAAVLGLALATNAVKERPLSFGLATLHGLFAASGLVVLILVVMNAAESGLGGWSLGIFVVAALGGFTLLSFHLRKKSLPIPLVVVHALAAVTAFALLLVWVLGV
jgi:hypothetical protein